MIRTDPKEQIFKKNQMKRISGKGPIPSHQDLRKSMRQMGAGSEKPVRPKIPSSAQLRPF
jgi:hypothetical protein